MVSKAFRLQIFSKVLPAKFPLLVSLLYPEILKFFSRVIPPKPSSWVPRFSSLVVHFSRCCFPAARAFPSSGTFSLAWNGQTVKRIFLENDGFFTTHFFPQFLHRPHARAPSSIFPLFQHAHVENIFSGSLCRRFHYCPKFLKKSIKELLFSRIVGIIIVSGPSGPQYAPVAQLDRALDSDSKGRAFESHRAYHKKQPVI